MLYPQARGSKQKTRTTTQADHDSCWDCVAEQLADGSHGRPGALEHAGDTFWTRQPGLEARFRRAALNENQQYTDHPYTGGQKNTLSEHQLRQGAKQEQPARGSMPARASRKEQEQQQHACLQWQSRQGSTVQAPNT